MSATLVNCSSGTGDGCGTPLPSCSFSTTPSSWYVDILDKPQYDFSLTQFQGFHCLVGSKYLNTVSNHGACTIAFSAVWAIISWAFSLPRTFSSLSKLGAVSAVFTFLSVLLAAIFAGAEGKTGTAGYDPAYPVNVLAVPAKGTTFVAGMSAFLNISYTFIGQITLPSFIAEMKEPKEFPKALWAVTVAEVFVFGICGAVTYAYTGTLYNTAPAFGSIGNHTYQIVSFSFMIPTLIFLGVLYASVSARFIFFNAFAGTRHLGSHTLIGWISWGGILAALWLFAFLIAEVIPFFSDLLSLMSSLFDSFFGFIFWGVAYIRMRKADHGDKYITSRGIRSITGWVINVFWIIVGVYFLTVGTYVSVQSIIDGYHQASFGGAFTCADNGLMAVNVTATAA